MGKRNRSTRARHNLMIRLHMEQKGLCKQCTKPIALAFARLKEGWRFTKKDNMLLSPDGKLIRVATIEHIKPRCMGGNSKQTNICLLCRQCNTDNGKPQNLRKHMPGSFNYGLH